jgi:hypothetical protein
MVVAFWAAPLRFVAVSLRSRTALAAENLFLRRQLALYQERQVSPRRASDPTRVGLVLLARFFAWKEALIIVQPETLIRWHRKGFRLFWRWRSSPGGRPRLPADLRQLIGEMARSNPTWGERADSGGAFAKAKAPRVAPDRAPPYTERTWEENRPALGAVEHLRVEPGPRDARLRFLCHGDRRVQGAVRLRRDGSGESAAGAR